MEELKPCPFCGCNAIVIANRYRHDETCFYVKCRNNECFVIPETYAHSDMECAIEAWNRRADKCTDSQ